MVLEPLVESLRTSYPSLPDPALVDQAAADAVLSYAERPTQFDPSQRGLFGYLKMSARGDLLNAIAADARRGRHEVTLEDVELPSSGRKKVLITSERAIGVDDEVVDMLMTQRLMKQVRAAVDSPADAAALQMIIDGERRTDRFAAVLGLGDLSPVEQTRAVKRHKDRLKKRVQRLSLEVKRDE